MYMKLNEFRTQQQDKRSFPILGILSGLFLLFAAILLAIELIQYSDIYNNVNETFGEDVIIGGVQVGGLNEADRLSRLESIYVEQPILLNYNGSPILLTPRDIGFRLDTEAMQVSS